VPTAADAAPEQGAEAAQSGAVAAPRPHGEIGSRADIQRLLDKMCTYYAEHEPGSPVPALLRRAARLVDMSFAELLQELAPDGLNQYAQVSGVRNEN
ncbi:type VI secretion system protein TssA, partial [Duganella callida]|uniref:type VI secretion system protein TssA n=1 Tax=Duganella callida TaxID=2561932 RepID=UPI003530DF9C